MNDKIKYICDNWICLTIALAIGYILHLFISSKKDGRLTNRRLTIKKLDNVVLYFSFIGAVACLIIGISNKEDSINVQILGFYTSFIFSWLLTKKSSKEEFKEAQNDIAQNTYRHIQDIETAALVAIRRTRELQEKECINKDDVNGISDELQIILTGIRTNEEDWKDMLNEENREKIENQDDPETKLLKSEVRQLTPDKLSDLQDSLKANGQKGQEEEETKIN